MTLPELIQIVTIGTNISIIVVGIKLVRHISRMEFKVDTMWSVFIRRFGERTEAAEE